MQWISRGGKKRIAAIATAVVYATRHSTDKTLRRKIIPDKLKFISSKTFGRRERSNKHSTSHVSCVCLCIQSETFIVVCDLMMPNTIPRTNQSNFYLVFDCLKIELGQFCHVINRCNFLESNCITITFWYTINDETTTWFRRMYTHSDYNKNDRFSPRVRAQWTSIQTMMNWAYLIWPRRESEHSNYRQFRFSI